MSEGASNEDATSRQQRIWKKNVPFLYDTVITKELEWPSLTVQWMPDVVRPEGADQSVHRMLLGTHTAGGVQNHLMVSKLTIPTDDSGQFDASKYDSERDEFGGYGAGSTAKLEHEIRINHPGEVHRARYMPHNPIIIASRGPADDVYIFDYTKHPSEPIDGRLLPQLRLKGHDGEGYGISWSNTREGILLTAGDDGSTCHWDINMNQTIAGQIGPVNRFRGHDSNVEDVAFHALHEYAFGSVGGDRKLNLWDLRDSKRPQLSSIGHVAEVNCIAFNPFSEFILATGSADSMVAVWDMRNLGRHLHKLNHHSDEVFQVAFSPHYETILASSGSDDRVIVWDISRAPVASGSGSTASSSPSTASSSATSHRSPPEVLFIHEGHEGKVADFSWNPNRPLTICSSDEYNKLQTWEVSATAILPEISETGK